MKVYKGFDKDLCCRGYQYEVGGEYEESEAKLCEKGFHACENPLDVLRYYSPAEGSRYCTAELEGSGEQSGTDSKVVGEKIKIGAEIGLRGLISAGVEFVLEKCKDADVETATGNFGNAAASGNSGNAAASGNFGNAAASGNFGNAAAAGYSGNAAASGNFGNAAASGNSGNAAATGNSGNAAASGNFGNAVAAGDYGNAVAAGDYGNAVAAGYSGNAAASGNFGNAVAAGDYGNAVAAGDHGCAAVSGDHGSANAAGKQCIAVGWGPNCRAKGALGSYIVLAEYGDDIIKCAKLAYVDGDAIKADTWYVLDNGEFVEADDEEYDT